MGFRNTNGESAKVSSQVKVNSTDVSSNDVLKKVWKVKTVTRASPPMVTIRNTTGQTGVSRAPTPLKNKSPT